MGIEVVSRKTGICPFCGNSLTAFNKTIEEYSMSSGGYTMRRIGVKRFIEVRCKSCGFSTKMKYTIEGALSPNGKASNELGLEKPNSIGRVVE